MDESTKSVWKISVLNSLLKMITIFASFFWAIFYNSIGFSGTQIGIILGAFSITGLITTLPSGFINDKIKSKNLITIGILLIATHFIGVGLFPKFLPVLIFSIIGGFGNYLYVTSSESFFYKITEKTNIEKKIAIFQSLTYLTMGIGIAVGGRLLDMNIPFEKVVIGAGIFFIFLAIYSRILPKSVTTELELVHYKKDIFQPKVLLFLAIMGLFAFHYGAENTSYGLFLRKTLGLSNFQSGLYIGLSIIPMGISAIFFTKILKKIQVKNLLFFGLIASAIGHILMTVNDPIYSYLFRMFHEIGDSAVFVFMAYGITSMFDLKRVGGNNGVIYFTIIIFTALSNLITGPMGEKYGYNIPLIVTGVVLMIAFAIGIIFNNLIIKNQEK